VRFRKGKAVVDDDCEKGDIIRKWIVHTVETKINAINILRKPG
jgi:hypothetical protein